MHPFREFILRYANLSEQDWKPIEASLQRKEYQSGSLILEDGKICTKLYFLESGFLRYFINRDGEEVTKYFTEPPYAFTSQRSFNNNTPTNDNIQALEDSVVWEIDRADALELLKLPNWSEFVRKLVQEVQFYTEEILETLQNDTAEERYIKMIEQNSVLLQKVPQKHIASYLGIAPQSLSRIRKKYYDEKTKLT